MEATMPAAVDDADAGKALPLQLGAAEGAAACGSVGAVDCAALRARIDQQLA